MRRPILTPSLSQPYTVVIVYDSSTSAPVFAMTSYGLGVLDADTISYLGAKIPVRPILDDIEVTDTKPGTLGAGLARKTASFNIRTGSPFFTAPISTLLYGAGATIDEFFFGIWTTDYSQSVKDITATGTFFGYFKLDAGVQWSEGDATTKIRLIEYVLLMTGRYNDNTEAAEEVLAGSEWSNLLSLPAILGHRTGVPAITRAQATIGGFEAYNKGVLGVIAGIVQSSALSGTSINLGKSPTLAAIVGDTVKLKMGNGCIIQGVITSLGGGEYGINTTGLILNAAWDTVTVYNKGFTSTGQPVGIIPSTSTAENTDLRAIFIDNSMPLTRIPSPYMYLKSAGTLEFYDSGPVTSAGAIFVKLAGIADEANKELNCEEIKDPANPTWRYGGVNVNFNIASQSSVWTDPDSQHLNYASWLAPQSYSLYFTNKTYVLADIQREGMPWELIVTPHVNAAVPLEVVYYARLIEGTTIAESATGTLAVYAYNGSVPVPIQPTEIDTITYNNTDFGMVELCKIKLKRTLQAINEAFDPNFIYIDTGPALYAGEVVEYILRMGGVHPSMLGATLQSTTGRLGNTLSLEIRDETWTELLDSVVFESGCVLTSFAGVYDLYNAFNRARVRTWTREAPNNDSYVTVTTEAAIPYDDVIDGTYGMDIGRNYTSKASTGQEFVRVHYTFRFKVSSIGGEKLRTLQSIRVPKNNDRKIEYTFKHITDSVTATAAAGQMTKLGHPGCISETTRQVTVGLPLKYITLEAIDTARLINFRHINALNEPLAAYSANNANSAYTIGSDDLVVAKYDADVQHMLLPGTGFISEVKLNLSGAPVPVSVTFKQAQFSTASNLRGVAEILKLNDEATNTAEGAINQPTGVVNNTPNGLYPCPPDTASFSVVIIPGDKISGRTILDACCNVKSQTDDAYTDGQVIATCQPVNGNDDPWPDSCWVQGDVYYTPQTDSEIGNTDTLVFNFYTNQPRFALGMSVDYWGTGYPILVEVSWPGKPATNANTHAQFFRFDDGVSQKFGELHVYPAIFSSPENMYSKPVTLLFKIVRCSRVWGGTVYNTNPLGSGATINWEATSKNYKNVTRFEDQYISVPITLRPVSDIQLTGG